jgi:hypothetical protein
MTGKSDSRRIGARARRVFLRALRRGGRIDEAAAAAGHSEAGFCALRRRDPDFARGWEAAMAASAGLRLVRPNGRRRLQLRRMRHVRFDDSRKEAFLNHFAGCCDASESAEVAGVDESTVYKHRRKDPVFAAAFDEALAQGYARLEAEALRQRLEAQKRLRRAIDDGVPSGEIAAEFERVLKLLQRWDRKSDRPGVRAIAQSRKPALSFEEALALLERKLRNLDIPILELKPEIARRYDGDEAEAGDSSPSGPPEGGTDGE